MRVCVLFLLCACGSVEKSKTDAGPIGDEMPSSPSVSGVTPPRGIVTTAITIAGTSFGDTQGSSTVSIGGKPATVQTWSATTIAATVPDVMPGDADVVVTTGSGTGQGAFRVILPARIYTENDTAVAPDNFNSVSVMTFDPATGAVAELQEITTGYAPVSFGGCASTILVDESSRHVFVGNGAKIAVYDIDPINGKLAPVAGSPFTSGMQGYGLAIDRTTQRLFESDYSGALVVMDVAADGKLTAVTGSPFVVPMGADVPALSQDGKFIYSNTESSTLLGYSVATNGALNALPGSPYNTGSFAYQFARRPGHDQFYVAPGGNTIQAWQAGADGALAQIAGSPFTSATTGLHDLVFTPDGDRAYIATQGGPMLTGLSLDAAGAPTPMAGSPWTIAGGAFVCLAMSSDGKWLIGAGEGNQQMNVMSIAADGTPSAAAGSPFLRTATEGTSGLAITF